MGRLNVRVWHHCAGMFCFFFFFFFSLWLVITDLTFRQMLPCLKKKKKERTRKKEKVILHRKWPILSCFSYIGISAICAIFEKMVTNGLATFNSIIKFCRVHRCFYFSMLVQHTDKCFFRQRKKNRVNEQDDQKHRQFFLPKMYFKEK